MSETVTGVDFSALTGWMDREGLGCGPVANVEQLAGGTQNILIRFHRDEREYVLRRPPVHLRNNSNETMRREARLLGALASTDVPHPGLIRSCTDEAVLGAAFYLMEPVKGFNPVTGLPALHAGSPEIRHSMGLKMVESIATLGALDYEALGLGDFGKPENYLDRQVKRWRAQFESYHEHAGWSGAADIPGVEKVSAWLARNRPAEFQPGIMHGDYHLANVMFRSDSPELAAIVDWELATIGDPLIDLGWLLCSWPDEAGHLPGGVSAQVRPWEGFPAASELVEHYRARSGRDLSDIGWYTVLACYKLGIILEGTYARACAGRAPKETGDTLHGHTISLFERALRWIG